MQLAKIKIAGFKSFVDPTTITLPGQLIAIVGPNGCGKSNIIDAVTWVMGESSPKYLRGESLTDVIFNGSSARKPVGQASVELVFDNNDGTLGGEYAKYAEISIKRQINRDSDSTYYLNGVRCRKRDVASLFYGTGLGPRSYSIIGQNMISRIIESKPDELRTYLEEAAGISKYKERRHETELRVHHAKENLARICDVRTELEKQLSHLKHQANTAEKFKSLKQQERVTRAELYGIQWRQLDSRMVDYTLRIQQEETALQARQSELTGTNREMEQARHEQRVAQDAFQEIQRHYYAVGNEITRIEQDILHHQERQTQWETDLEQVETDWQSVKSQISESEDESCDLARDIQQVEQQLATENSEMERSKEMLLVAEKEVQIWQDHWDDFNQTLSKTTQTAQVEQTHIQHLEQKIASLQKRQSQLQQQQNQYDFVELNDELEECAKKAIEANDQLEEQQEELLHRRKKMSSLQAAQQEDSVNLDKVRNELQRSRGQYASLEALQQTALGQRDNRAKPWLDKNNLGSKPRLAQHMEVEKGFEAAVEKVLGFCLQAICVDTLSDIASKLEQFDAGNLCVFASEPGKKSVKGSKKGVLLSEKVKTPWPVDSLLSGIYVADSLDEALKLCESLDHNESVVTKDGLWMNRGWLKILREQNPAAGVFQREQELKQLAIRIEELQEKQDELEQTLQSRREEIKELELKHDELQQMFNRLQGESAQLNAQHKSKKERLADLKTQLEHVLQEQEECLAQLMQAKSEESQAKALWQNAVASLEDQTQSRDNLLKERDKSRQQLHDMRNHVISKKEYSHALEIRLQTAKSQVASHQQNISRLHLQLSQLSERKITLQSELSSMPPMDSLKKTLTRALDKHVSVEVELNTARVGVESLEQEFRRLEDNKQIIERDSSKIRNVLENLRVELQGWKVKADTIIEQLKETEFTLEDILQNISHEITTEEWQSKLDQIVQRIARLGAINLMAIDEYATCLERKQYLDAQLDDLNAGLATLEEAISKIDKETKMRFKETFDKVNGRFQELFPTVFGGGKAYLELTNDDLLEAGVTMMACPPGKRNSSIYLLSGGEKSLTAIAFIFSIFHLNPAPFCMLDEVDAALDDANVIRFTRLVKAMIDKTQFFFISHNKVTIEMGQHLIGVTMNEPGVSRLVSVDIEKAISLAGA